MAVEITQKIYILMTAIPLHIKTSFNPSLRYIRSIEKNCEMNGNRNETNTTSEMVLAIELARDIVTNYGSRGISMVGIFVNLFGLLVLRNRHLVEKFYD